ncbi:flagellar hook-associated protein FlgK [Oryzomicrobium sp.]|uniref:flagellar hook-associated protein FlgK n=1 Tax=Oryzomicrobium sp. TaxID=1911578 RepID=UPI0025FF9DBE|nr:flagellar hook-associated protein FlgK [Oryzomicrobium sp.]MCE1241877.1 flagellar hook-associated protein FlgK [Oryzomicrobium sp.]
MTGIFSIGLTGINAAQYGLLTTSHNITNANTDGYNRQVISQATNIPLPTGAGFVGQGTHVATVQRMYNQFLSQQVMQAQTSANEYNTYYKQVSQVDNLLGDSNAGLSSALQGFFSGVQQLASKPGNSTVLATMVSSAQTLASRFQTMENQLNQLYQGTNQQITDTVNKINSYATQIAKLNESITMAQASTNQPPNDLLDQRDQLISQLNQEIRVTTVTQSDGSLSVLIGSGQQLVVGQQVSQLTTQPSQDDPTRMAVALQTGSVNMELPESLLSGGNLGGFLSFRSGALDDARNTLGQLAASVALTFNAQQALGQDLHGNVAGDVGFASQLFQISDPKVIRNSTSSNTAVLSASFQAPQNSNGNFSTQLTSSDYELQFGTGGAYTVVRLSDNSQVASGTVSGAPPTNVSFDGVQLSITTAGLNGDRFTIQPTKEVARNFAVNSAVIGDPSLVAAAAPIRASAALTNTGDATITQGSVGTGYTLPTTPLTLSYTNTPSSGLTGFPVGSTISVTDASGNTTTTTIAAATDVVAFGSGNTITINGPTVNAVSFSVSGTPKAGDQFTLQKNVAGVADGRNANLMGLLQTQQTMTGSGNGGGLTTFQDSYGALVARVGTKTNEVKVMGDSQSAQLASAQSSQQSLSGVNMDEEAANLIKYQYMYQASAKMLQVGSTIFDTILSIGR